MKFIPPLEISSKIMTLIEESNEELILVSPYLQITKWIKMKNCLERAVKRNVNITLYVREDIIQDYSFIKQIGVKLVLVRYLHAKVYLNEKRGIVTSQNMIYFSDINSIDVGYETEKSSERKELLDFVNNSIRYTELSRNIDPIKNEIISKTVKEELTVERTELSNFELEFLFKTLNKNFQNARLTKTSTYVFSGSILKFADVMIDNELILKVRKSRADFDQIIQKIETVKNQFKSDFNTKSLTTHKSFYYLTFIPNGNRNYKKIVHGFLEIIGKILESDI